MGVFWGGLPFWDVVEGVVFGGFRWFPWFPWFPWFTALLWGLGLCFFVYRV